MNSISQSNPIFPTTCEVVSTTRGAVCGYLHEIMVNFVCAVRGTLFVKNVKKGSIFYRKGLHFRVFSKTDISLCVQKLDLQQVIRYGGFLYLAAAMFFVTAGVCSRQVKLATCAEQAAGRAIHLPIVSPPMDPSADAGDADTAAQQTTSRQSAAALPEPREPALPFEEDILQAAQTYQVDPALIHAIIMAESSYNPRAVSHRGAQGLMQLMPTTAKWLGIEDSFDPAMNIDGGVRYFKRLLDRFDGDVKLALAAYNAGSRYVRKYGGVPPFKATRIYIKKVLHYHRVLQEQIAARGGNGLITG
jgi:hypothetical protein